MSICLRDILADTVYCVRILSAFISGTMLRCLFRFHMNFCPSVCLPYVFCPHSLHWVSCIYNWIWFCALCSAQHMVFYYTCIGLVQTDWSRYMCAVPIFMPPVCAHISNVTVTDDSWCHAIASCNGIMWLACKVVFGFAFVARKGVFERQWYVSVA